MDKAATAREFRQNLQDMHIPKGTGNLADYEHSKRLVNVWQRELARHGIATPPYETLIRVVADWVGV